MVVVTTYSFFQIVWLLTTQIIAANAGYNVTKQHDLFRVSQGYLPTDSTGIAVHHINNESLHKNGSQQATEHVNISNSNHKKQFSRENRVRSFEGVKLSARLSQHLSKSIEELVSQLLLKREAVSCNTTTCDVASKSKAKDSQSQLFPSSLISNGSSVSSSHFLMPASNIANVTKRTIRVKRTLKENWNRRHKPRKSLRIGGVYWDDVWRSTNIRWVAKMVDSNKMRPSDRQFFHRLLPMALRHLNSTCITLEEKDERDYTLLEKIHWKDPQLNQRYPRVPKQCSFGRSSGFLCLALNDGKRCYYVSGWAQDRVQALVDGRHSTCGPQQWLHMVGHALGLMHEHDRGDVFQHVHLHPRLRVLTRDDDLLEYRIPQDDCTALRQNKSDLPFDYNSLLLYDESFRPDSAGMDYELPMMPKLARDVQAVLAARPVGLSHYDRLKLRHLYGCSTGQCRSARPCENFGFRDKHCRCVCAPGFMGRLCEHKTGPGKTGCVQTVKDSDSFYLNKTKCKRESKQMFNYTLEVSGKRGDRFGITVDMTPVFMLLHGLRLLPSCEHARVYFTGWGMARPQVVCAETLLPKPMTFTTQYPFGLLVLVLRLPDVWSHQLTKVADADSLGDVIGKVHITVTIERSPAAELTVDTSRLTPPPTTLPATTTVTTTTITTTTTPSPLPVAMPAAYRTTSPPKTTKKPPPLKSLKRSKGQRTIKDAHPAMASRSSGQSKMAIGGMVAGITVMLILIAAIVLATYMAKHRGTGAESEGESDEGEGEDEAEEENEKEAERAPEEAGEKNETEIANKIGDIAAAE